MSFPSVALVALLASCESPGPEPGVASPAGPAPAAPADPAELLRRAREAVLAVPSARYDYHFQAFGGLAIAPQVSGDAWLARGPDLARARLRIHTELRPPPQVVSDEPPRRMDVASDGSTVTGLNHHHQIAYRGAVAEGADELISHFGGNGTLVAYLDPSPFARELDPSAQLSVQGEESIDGVACVWVRATQPDTGFRYEWAIASTDHLPRGYAEYLQAGDAETHTRVKVRGLQVGPEAPEPSLGLEAPAGWKEESLWTHLAVGAALPDLTLPDTSGAGVRLGELRGQVLVLATLSASGADPASQTLLPLLRELQGPAGGAGPRVLAVSVPGTEGPDPSGAWSQVGASFPLLLADQNTAAALRVRLPGVTYVVGEDGRLVLAETQPQTLTRERLQAAISAPSAP